MERPRSKQRVSKRKAPTMFKRIFKPFRRHRFPEFPGSAHLRRDIGIEQRDHFDMFLARHNPNLGGWV